MTQAEKWRKVRQTLLGWLLATLVIAGFASAYFWGIKAAGMVCGTALFLAFGLWITELLMGVLSGVRKANPPAIVLLMAGKLLWWGALILAAKRMPAGNELPIATGIGAFLVAIVITGISHYGMPRISEPSA